MSIMSQSCRGVLATGGAGFVGLYSVFQRLLEKAYLLTVLDNLSNGKWEILGGVLDFGLLLGCGEIFGNIVCASWVWGCS